MLKRMFLLGLTVTNLTLLKLLPKMKHLPGLTLKLNLWLFNNKSFSGSALLDFKSSISKSLSKKKWMPILKSELLNGDYTPNLELILKVPSREKSGSWKKRNRRSMLNILEEQKRMKHSRTDAQGILTWLKCGVKNPSTWEILLKTRPPKKKLSSTSLKKSSLTLFNCQESTLLTSNFSIITIWSNLHQSLMMERFTVLEPTPVHLELEICLSWTPKGLKFGLKLLLR